MTDAQQGSTQPAPGRRTAPGTQGPDGGTGGSTPSDGADGALGVTELAIEAHPRGAGAARALVARRLAAVAPRAVVDTAVLLTSELATNAVLHAQGAVTVRVGLEPGLVRVEVADASPTSPTLRQPRLDATGGRGLVLVEALSTRWGSRLATSGKTVWFELAL